MAGGEPKIAAVAIVDDSSLSATEKLAAALDRAELWTIVNRFMADRELADFRLVIKPELAGYSAGSPTATDPRLVEDLVDLLCDHGFSNVAIVHPRYHRSTCSNCHHHL